ncbi:MAG: hypothetical protein ABSF29_15950 [Tepidisphaeraceae bacterium]|jgi:hypothetical protein
MTRSRLLLPLAGAALALAFLLPTPILRADYPQPSPFPVSWELTVDFAKPRRILVQSPGDDTLKPYWYITYHVVNNTDKDTILFYPSFDLLTQDGQVIHSDSIDVKPAVFAAIQDKERIKFLQDANDIAGPLRQGDDQSKDGVAIWPEPNPRMGTFSIFASGFWGESAIVKVADATLVLHKTLQETFHLDSDAAHPGEGALVQEDSQYVMR